MSLLNRLERFFGRLAIPNITLYLVFGQVLFWSVSFFGLFRLERKLTNIEHQIHNDK